MYSKSSPVQITEFSTMNKGTVTTEVSPILTSTKYGLGVVYTFMGSILVRHVLTYTVNYRSKVAGA